MVALAKRPINVETRPARQRRQPASKQVLWLYYTCDTDQVVDEPDHLYTQIAINYVVYNPNKKIEKYMAHIANSEDLLSRLSQQEQRFAKSCKEIMEKHLEQSVLSKLPYGYDSVTRQSLSSTEDDMVPEPQLDTFVFCKTKSDVGAFQLDDVGEEVVDLVADDLYVLRYKSIKGLVEAGRIDLI
ncbi:hypothetical protein TRIUR3_02305 [Triticum urartu]|uniref:DNA replication complex GINS protein SLD5 C-terminal domain-containing protein n=1 Tax=Triticum urartu TaxID=4572 RepID=M7ZXM5_TRIUA|nr:hypothetical protein TRIUR3_02305 [Triticum urartu]